MGEKEFKWRGTDSKYVSWDRRRKQLAGGIQLGTLVEAKFNPIGPNRPVFVAQECLSICVSVFVFTHGGNSSNSVTPT